MKLLFIIGLLEENFDFLKIEFNYSNNSPTVEFLSEIN
jgi:hypothetical protein